MDTGIIAAHVYLYAAAAGLAAWFSPPCRRNWACGKISMPSSDRRSATASGEDGAASLEALGQYGPDHGWRDMKRSAGQSAVGESSRRRAHKVIPAACLNSIRR